MENFDAQFRKVWKTFELLAEDRRKWEEAAAKRRAEWAAAAEKRRAEWEAESAKRHAVLDKRMSEFDARMEKWSAESAKRHAEIDRLQKENARNIGDFTNSEGECLEDEFAEALREDMRIGGRALDDVALRVRAKYEYDIVGINGDFAAVGEIKRKLSPADVRHFAEERLPHFAEDCPLIAARRKIYGMVGGKIIAAAAQKEAEKRGLYILRLKNKKLVVQNSGGARPVS